MNKYEKQERFLNVLFAFQAFAGKSMKAIDSAEALSDADLHGMECGLLRMALSLKQEDKSRFPDLHELAEKIQRKLLKNPTDTFNDVVRS